ncbi:RNA 3'-terminal phosphate cyclase [Candidatus Woesearchaeota archaeon]|nr:RNA 3'-terminal phosphate cyclase [Candidatus Woesearchaeota archaeon]
MEKNKNNPDSSEYKMIELDGSYGEGGGQILRTALALSILTQKPFHIIRIRHGREKPGLKPQHFHSIKALQKLTNSEVSNLKMGSEEITFKPKPIKENSLNIDVGTAGSLTLLLQSLLLPCINSEKDICIKMKGGTDVSWSQPIDHLQYVFLPLIKEFSDIEFELIQRGYYPKGQGKIKLKIPAKKIIPDEINHIEKGSLKKIKIISHAHKDLKNSNVAERQLKSCKKMLNSFFYHENINPEIETTTDYQNTQSIGSGISVIGIYENTRIGSDSLGEKGKKSEIIGKEAAERLILEIQKDAVVDKFTADQLIPFMALTKKAKIKTSQITDHILSNIYTAEKFMDIKFSIELKNNIIEKI